MLKGSLARAIGWSAITIVAALLGLSFSGRFKAAGVPVGTSYGWIAFLAVVAQSLLTDEVPLMPIYMVK